MDTKQQLAQNEQLISTLEGKRKDTLAFIAKAVQGNPKLEKAFEDLQIINGSLEKAYEAKDELNKALEQEELEKAEGTGEGASGEGKQDPDNDPLDKGEGCHEEIEKAKDELRSEINEAIIAERAFDDEYVKQLADKFKISEDDVEDMIAQCLEANGGEDA